MTDRQVTVYTTPSCPHCRTVKEFLSRKGVSYTEHDVAKDQQAREDMIRKAGRMAVPTITVGDQVVVGYNPNELEKLLH